MKHENLIIGEELERVHRFMTNNNIDFAITGSMSLQMIGAFPTEENVRDVDVITYFDTQEEKDRLEDLFRNLDELHGGWHEKMVKENHYQNPPYCFSIGDRGITINVWVFGTAHDEPIDTIDVVIDDKKYKVHTFRSAMHNKMKLMRKKDFIFQARLIRYITQIGNKEIFNKKPIRF